MKENLFSLIGTGRLGTCLARALSGSKFKLAGFFDIRPASAQESRRLLGQGEIFATLREAAAAGDIIFLTVRDDALPEVIHQLSSLNVDWSKKYIFHCSGFHPSSLLAPLKIKGALTGSLHPIQSFPSKNLPPQIFRKIFFTFEGEAQAQLLAEEIVIVLGGRLVRLSPEKKPLYHTACSLASNHLIGLISASVKLLEEAGFSSEKAVAMLLPLVQQTLKNIQSLGLDKSLTGPLQRGDIQTVTEQLKSLASSPQTKEIYRALSLFLLELADKQGELSSDQKHHLKHLLVKK